MSMVEEATPVLLDPRIVEGFLAEFDVLVGDLMNSSTRRGEYVKFDEVMDLILDTRQVVKDLGGKDNVTAN